MKIFFTDDKEFYKSDLSPVRVLFQDYFIKEVSGVSPEIIQKNYYSNSDIEFRAGELMFSELNSIIKKLSGIDLCPNRYMKTRNAEDQAFTLLYPFAKKYLLPKYILLLTVNDFLKHAGFLQASGKSMQIEVSFNLSHLYSLAEKELKNISIFTNINFVFRETKNKTLGLFSKSIKSLYYVFFNLFYSAIFSVFMKKKITVRHVLLIMYDVSPNFILLETFIGLVKNNPDIHLSIIQIDSNDEPGSTISAKPFKSGNIDVYKFINFRKRKKTDPSLFYKAICGVDPAFEMFEQDDLLETINLHHEWMNNVIQKLKPDVTMYCYLEEMGRIVSDTSRFNEIPSVCLEYAFTFDSPFLNQNMHYTARACINEYTKNGWIKHHDPTDLHPVIGFTKLDALSKEEEVDKLGFFRMNGLNPNKKTIFFASTWTSDNKVFDSEKKIIVEELIEMCDKNKWNLIIKKHPNELDSIVDEVMSIHPKPNQKLFRHEDLPLAKAIQICDFMCCQSSSAILEAIYYNKPFCFLNKSTHSTLSDYLVFEDEDQIKTYNNMTDFELILTDLFNRSKNGADFYDFPAMQRKYLFKKDGLASQRLLDLLLHINYIPIKT